MTTPSSPKPAPLASDTTYQAMIHRHHHTARRRIIAGLVNAAAAIPAEIDDSTPNRPSKLATKLTMCCSSACIAADPEAGVVRMEQARCNSRVCPRCSMMRARELEGRVVEAIDGIDSPGLITLTLASTDQPLRTQLDRLKVCFRALRRRRAWKDHVKGGIAVVEVTYSARLGQWHPHLHVLADFAYWHQKALSLEWLAVTGDSQICDIRRVASKRAMARYVAKYVTKGSDSASLPGRRIAEWALAIAGLRIAQPFGHLHGMKTRTDRPKSRGTTTIIAYTAELHEASVTGDQTAADLLRGIADFPRWETDDPVPNSIIETAKTLVERLKVWVARHRGGPIYTPDEPVTRHRPSNQIPMSYE